MAPKGAQKQRQKDRLIGLNSYLSQITNLDATTDCVVLLQLMKKLGFKHFEVWVSDPHFHSKPDINDA